MAVKQTWIDNRFHKIVQHLWLHAFHRQLFLLSRSAVCKIKHKYLQWKSTGQGIPGGLKACVIVKTRTLLHYIDQKWQKIHFYFK